MFTYGVVPGVKPMAILNPRSAHCSCYSELREVCVCVCVRVRGYSPTPSSNFASLPWFHFSFTPSQLCSLTHSEPSQKLAEQLLQ